MQNTEGMSGLPDSLKERLGKTVLKGIEGKQNGLICFEKNRDAYIRVTTPTIAWTALSGNLAMGNYTHLGLNEFSTDQFTALLRATPIYPTIKDYLQTDRIFEKGSKDYLGFQMDQMLISFSWLPSHDTTGDHRLARSVLIAHLDPDSIHELMEIAHSNPQHIYTLLLSSLYPNSFIPLSENEVLDAISQEGPEFLRLAKAHKRQNIVDLVEAGLNHPKELTNFVISNSTLKRLKPCAKVEVLTN